MYSKYIFLCILTAWTMGSMSTAQSSCTRPANPLKITANQIKGVWYYRMDAVSGNHNATCARFKFEFSSSTSGIADDFWVYPKGQSAAIKYRVDILRDEAVHIRSIEEFKHNVFWYVLLINNNDLVVSACSFMDGKMRWPQMARVLTRSPTTSKARAKALLRQAGVTINKPYYYKNLKKCRL